jgi:RND family efflux transporter MFP subunit
MRNFILLMMLITASTNSPVYAEEPAHEEHGHEAGGHEENDKEEDGHEEETAAELSEAQINMAGIEVIQVTPAAVADIITAPGEVNLNAYKSTRVTPRIEAQIIERKATLGEQVTSGQPLVTLSSVDMAEAQGALLVTDREWRRVKKLGRKVVSERRYIEAQVARQQAWGKVLAYGMTKAQTNSLLQQGKASRATGSFDLLSPQNGTVISDDFIVGELAEPGRLLFSITDESTLWIDARLTPEQAGLVEVGQMATIKTRDLELPGKVIQTKHALDESTRTLSVRIEVDNPDDRLHPGQFVTAEIQSNQQEQAITVPVSAVLRSPDGDWQVFLEEKPGRYEPREVEVKRTVGDRMVVTGLTNGERIVSKGAFFIQSEIAKSGFEIHNH